MTTNLETDATIEAARPADAAPVGWLSAAPTKLRPFLSLSRADRPVGFWLLALPCWIGVAFARIDGGWRLMDIAWVFLFGLGAVAMRGAGCTWNDIADRKIDAQVARTAGRPLPSGQVSLRDASVWLGAQLFAGFLIWAALPAVGKIVAALAIPLVAAYPFMKRITWWPQAWLGLAFNWGALVAAATIGGLTAAEAALTVVLFIGLALWTVGYDTIYALQDLEDDALIGVKSTARLFGERAVLGAFAFHLGAAALIGLSAWIAGGGPIASVAVLAFLLHGVWQALRVGRSRGAALSAFKSNVWAGAALALGFAAAGLF